MFSMMRFLTSLHHAANGIVWALRTQANLRIHLAATLMVTAAGIVSRLPAWKWCVLLLAFGLVWTAELLNTALEMLCDRVSGEREESIRRIKDVGAGAVLAASLASLGLGLLVFYESIQNAFFRF